MATFSNGNVAHLSHGAYSDRRVNPVARELVEGLIVERPDLGDHLAAVWSWARIESKCVLLEAWLDEHGFIDGDGKPTAPAQLVTRYEKLAMALRSRLGLDPLSQAQLQNSRAQVTLSTYDIEELRARGREVIELRGHS